MPKPKPSTISRDPYAADPYAFIGTTAGQPEPAKSPEVPPAPPQAKKAGTEKITTPFPAELIERARTAVYWEPDLTLAGLIVGAVAEVLDRMEQGRGGPYPPRNRKLRSGRPIGSGKNKEGL